MEETWKSKNQITNNKPRDVFNNCFKTIRQTICENKSRALNEKYSEVIGKLRHNNHAVLVNSVWQDEVLSHINTLNTCGICNNFLSSVSVIHR